MIKKVWGLKLDEDIVGVRVQVVNGDLYDIDIDVYTKKLGLSTKGMKTLDLIAYGDLLMTEEEFYSGQLIEDGSNKRELLNAVKTKYGKKANDLEKDSFKWNKKKSEYQQKYYSYIPTRWLPYFAEYHLENFEGNGNIYTELSPEQVTLIKKYFRWRSRLLFDEQKASTLLRTKPVKTQKLVALMGNAEDWEYDGTVDTGYMGGGVCELGHSLRYEHYAVSPSARKQIIFGKTCMSDFFQVDEKVLNQIVQAQEMLLKELKAIVFILKTGRFEEYKETYKELPTLLTYFNDKKKSLSATNNQWLTFMSLFDKFDLPLTRSMNLQFSKLNDVLVEDKKKENANALLEVAVQGLIDRGYPKEIIDGVMYNKYELLLARILRASIVAGNIQSPFVEEGLGIIEDLNRVRGVITNQKLTPTQLKYKADEVYYFVNAPSGRRLATKKELKYARHLTKLENLLEPPKPKYLETLLKHTTSTAFDFELTSTLTLKQKGFIDKFMVNLDEFISALNWGMSPKFLEDMELLQAYTKQPESATDEVFDKYHILYNFDTIVENMGILTDRARTRFQKLNRNTIANSTEIDFVHGLFDSVLTALEKGGKADIPSSDYKLKEDKPAEPKPSVALDDDLDAKLDRILAALSSGTLAPTNFVFQVLPTIRKTGKMTVKQQKFVDDALKYIDKKS